MREIIKRVKIDVSAGRVWQVFEDFGNVKPWNPTVVESYISVKSKKNKRVGMARVLRYHSRKEVDEIITAWQERKGFTIAFPGAVGALKSYEQEWALEGTKDEALVTATIRYQMKWGFLGSFLNFTVFKKHFNRELTVALAGLKHYIETGEEVNMKSKNLPISSVEFKR